MPAATSVTAELFLALPDRYDQYGNRIKEELIEGEIVPIGAGIRKLKSSAYIAEPLLPAFKTPVSAFFED